jgi:nitroreductase
VSHWSEADRLEPAFPSWAGPAERLRHLLRYAIRAPSRHNAQPWVFDIEGPELRLHVDLRRSLRAADPLGREAAIACGAALENLRLAAAHVGHDLDIEPRDPGRDGAVAVVRLAGRRLATPAEEELFAAIPLRRTAVVLSSRPVPLEDMAKLAAEVSGHGMFRRVPRWLARPVAELVAEADGVQWSSARFRAEHALWTRGQGRRFLDGVAADRQPGAGSPAGLLRRLLHRARGARAAELDRRADERTRSLLVLSTRDDGPCEWLAAGRAMQRLLLRATACGLSVSFMSQPVEVPDVRRRLRRELGDPGQPQLLLRVGYGPRQRATPRRPVDLVVRAFATELSVEIGIEAEPAPLARPA